MIFVWLPLSQIVVDVTCKKPYWCDIFWPWNVEEEERCKKYDYAFCGGMIYVGF